MGDASEVEELKFADPISEDVSDGVGCAGALYGEGRYVWFDDVDVVAAVVTVVLGFDSSSKA